VRLSGFGVSAGTALVLVLNSLGSIWTRAYRPADSLSAAEAPPLGLWASPVWLTGAYFVAVLAVATLLALCLVVAARSRPLVGALGYVAITAQTIVVFAIAQREVAVRESDGFPQTFFDSGFDAAVWAAVASALAMAFAIWRPRRQL